MRSTHRILVRACYWRDGGTGLMSWWRGKVLSEIISFVVLPGAH
jgi:hypothetical protein